MIKAPSLDDLRAMMDGTYVHPPRPVFDPEQDAIFAGIARVRLEEPVPVDLAPGLRLRPSYAHVFAHPTVAFAPPVRANAASPGPWAAVENGSNVETAFVELSLSAGCRPFSFDRMSCLWVVVSLIRLLAGHPVCVPIVSTVPLSDVSYGADDALIWQQEPFCPTHRGFPAVLDGSFLRLLSAYLPRFAALLDDSLIYRAFVLFDGLWWLPSRSAQMVAIWAAAEALMRPGRQGIGKGLAQAVRAYIGRDRSDGDKLFVEVTRLYAVRGSFAHGAGDVLSAEVHASYDLVRSLFMRALEDGVRPPEPPSR